MTAAAARARIVGRVLLAMLLACPKPTPAPASDVVPTLPSPRGEVYGNVPATPRDPKVAEAARGLPWDEVLSGAATALALEALAGEASDVREVRWRAIVAGYPWPVVGRAMAKARLGEIPTGLVEEARRTGGDDVGLVRARGEDGDLWVLLVGRRRGPVPAVAREARIREVVALGPGAWVVSDADGDVRRPDGSVVLDEVGEWLFRLEASGVAVATFPVYVATATPETPPVRALASPAGSWEEEARAIADAARARVGLGALGDEPGLDSVARARLRAVMEAGSAPPAEAQLRAAGYVGVPVAGAECRAPTVVDCLDAIWWDPFRRGVLVGAFDAMGVAAHEADGQVVLALVAAG
ncbi:MAG: hypothetical protein ACOZNI_37100 [Myxococcota bacterium]